MGASAFAPVEQRHLYAKGQHGDCVAACVASIFGLSLDELAEQGIGPGACFQELFYWTKTYRAGLEYRERNLCVNHRMPEPGRWEYDMPPDDHTLPPTYGLWIAHVVSPRGLLLDGPYRGMPIIHAVVMRASALVWDPHPDRASGVGQMVGQGWWVAAETGLVAV